jgi:hypothetical protein
MNLIPLLSSFNRLRIFFAKLLAQLMQLPKEPSPSLDDGLVFHPPKLEKGKGVSVSPLENCNDKVSYNDESLMS